MDTGTTGGQHRLCGGAVQEIPNPAGCAVELPEDRAEPGHPARGRNSKLAS